MVQPFGHEKLIVYKKGMRFATWRAALLHELARRVAVARLEEGRELLRRVGATAASTINIFFIVVFPFSNLRHPA